MKKTITLTYPAGPERVSAMLADPDYQRKRVERADWNAVPVKLEYHSG